MRRLRATVCLVFVLACIISAGYTVKSKMIEDHTPPVITCEEDKVTVSVNAEAEEQEKALFEGVKAKDNRDGDITKSVRIASMSHFIAPGKRTITYVVFDKANQVGTLERTVEYTDYVSPRIYLKEPLRFTQKEMGKSSLTANMTAADCLDGDITNQIRTTLDDSFYSYAPGVSTIVAQVNNSAGDVCSVPLEVMITDADDRQERYKEYPILSEYIVYTSVGQGIDPMAYLIGIEKNGIKYTYEQDGEYLAGTREAVGVNANVDYSTPGIYGVEFVYTADGAATAITKMYVVVEGVQEGEADGE